MDKEYVDRVVQGGSMIHSVGIDIVEICRIEKLLHKQPERFLKRVFTPAEQAYCLAKSHAATHLAGRFAAKEAVLKVLGTGLRDVKWTEIEIIRDELGKPQVRFNGKARMLARKQEISAVLLSISHSRAYAVAQAVGIKEA